MGQLVRISVLAPDDVLRDYGPAALIHLERSATEAGAYSEVEETTVLDGVFAYEIYDSTGFDTDWYKYRFSDAGETTFSGYTDPKSPSTPDAYATLDDLLITMGQPIDDTRFHANAERRLREATLDLDREIGYSALHWTGTKILNGNGKNLIHVHDGIVSLTGIDIRLYTSAAWTPLQAQDTGWFLEGALNDPNADNGIYYHVRLSDLATYVEFPAVHQGIRLTGTFGGDTEARRAATVAWARQRLALDPATAGGVLSGPEDLGGAVMVDRWPRAVYDLIAAERHRFWCHV